MSFAIQSCKSLFRSNTFYRRYLSTISASQLGNPSNVLTISKSVPLLKEPSINEVKISVKSSGVLLEDIRAIMGLSPNKVWDHYKSWDYSCGSTAYGTVIAVPDGSEFAVNDTVLAVSTGLWTNEAIVSSDGVCKVPKLSATEAAALPSYIAAWIILHNFVTLKAGDIVVQATGECAIGSAISQIGKSIGLLVTSITDEELNDPQIASKLKEKGKIMLTVSGQSSKSLSLVTKAIAPHGCLVTYNGIYQSLNHTDPIKMPISNMIFKDISIYGFDFISYVTSNPYEYKLATTSVLSLVESKKILLKPSKVYPQTDYLKAIDDVLKTGNSVVLTH